MRSVLIIPFVPLIITMILVLTITAVVMNRIDNLNHRELDL